MIIFTIIGALIGAGFASGQEIYLFFYKYGKWGFFGILLCSFIIGFIIYKTFNIIYTKKVKDYKEFLDLIFKNKKISFFINIVINTFLCITFFIMISGFGAYFKQEFGMSNYIGASILAIICYFVFLGNIEKIAKINFIVVPTLVLFIFIVGVKNLFCISTNEFFINIEEENGVFGIVQAVIYASYNLILLIPVLINLNKFIKGKKHIICISAFVGIIMCIITMLIFCLLVNVKIGFNELEMPVVYVLKTKFWKFRMGYGIIILIAIFTTAISVGISFLNNVCKNENSFPQFALVLCITSVLISNFGFSNLVKVSFPLFGYLGLIQMWKCWKC